jgi:predicted esterase
MRRLAAAVVLALGPLFAAAVAGAPDAAAEPSADAPPGRSTVEVPGDDPIEVVLGPATSPEVLVYLHGVCGDPLAFESWAAEAARHATLVSVRGDLVCKKRKERREWSYEYGRIDRRIGRAVAAAAAARRRALGADAAALDQDHLTIAGYSQGARRVEALARRFPARYRRVLLAAIAVEPSVDALRKATRIVLVAGELDAKDHIQEGARKLSDAGKDVLYVELPRAHHGEYGPRAAETMGKALDWLFKPPTGN